jgi:hypothetical protein
MASYIRHSLADHPEMPPGKTLFDMIDVPGNARRRFQRLDARCQTAFCLLAIFDVGTLNIV